MNIYGKVGALLLSLAMVAMTFETSLAYAGQFTPGTMSSPPGSSSSSSITWTGATTITSATSTEDQTYSSTSADENALLVNTGDAVSIANPTVTKSGGTSASDNYSFYGINSAVMCKGGGTTTITGGSVTTNAAGANGVFSYGANSGKTNATGDGTTVVISDTEITTTGSGSGGIMTTYGGTTKASNLTITTSGGSSAPIRTDRGGGWVTVDGGTYTSSGTGSPAIYSTADVDVSNATLVSKASEGVCIEGNGSIELTDCTLTASNTKKNGNAQYYDTIMIYQSMSGDATGTGSVFSMTGGTLNSENGHVFHVTNTSATINLNGVDINNSDSDGVLLSVVNDGWSGNANTATVNATGQTLVGDIIVSSAASTKSSSASSLTLNLTEGSTFAGAISDGAGSNNFSSVAVVIDEGSGWKLTGDSYVSSVSGAGAIDYNGYTLTVGSDTYTSGAIGDVSESNVEVPETTDATDDTDADTTDATDATDDADVEGAMYRLYNPYTGEHFYTSDASERNSVRDAGWTYEGIGWTAPETGLAVYRLYNSYAGEHHYTLDATERASLLAAGWTDEGIGWYSDTAESVPLYREYNPNMFSCNHNYTADSAEHASLVAAGWTDEGIAWYGV